MRENNGLGSGFHIATYQPTGRRVPNLAGAEKVELDIARRIAWSFHRTTGINYDDLFGEAILAYANALEARRRGLYDPEIAAFTTYVYRAIQFRLRSAIKQRRYQSLGDEEPSPMMPDHQIPPPDRGAIFSSLVSNLAEEAKFAIRLVLESPVEFATMGRRAAQRKVRRELIRKGFGADDVDRTFGDIKQVLAQV